MATNEIEARRRCNNNKKTDPHTHAHDKEPHSQITLLCRSYIIWQCTLELIYTRRPRMEKKESAKQPNGNEERL